VELYRSSRIPGRPKGDRVFGRPGIRLVKNNLLCTLTSFTVFEFVFIQYRFSIYCLSALTLLVGCQEENLACKILSDDVLAWLSIWNEVQVICVSSSWCHCQCHPFVSWFIKIQIDLTFLLLAYPGCPGKKARCLYRLEVDIQQEIRVGSLPLTW